MRWVVAWLIVLGVPGCIEEVEDRLCFEDGAPYQGGRVSKICCDPGDPDARTTCVQAYSDSTFSSEAYRNLVDCHPDGYCFANCQPGTNCACFPWEGACDCRWSASADACQSAGQSAATGCTLCQ